MAQSRFPLALSPRRVLALSPRRVLALAAVTAALAIPATSFRTSAQSTIYGLWRDQTGGTWCGSTCGANQQCCTITPVNPLPPA